MMSRMFKGSVAILAMTAILGMPVATMAQTASGAPTNEAPAATAPAQTPAQTPAAPETAAPVALPQLLQDLALGDLSTRTDRRGGLRVSGKLADGNTLKAMVDNAENGGALRGAIVEGEGALPQSLSDALIPQAVRDQQIFGQFATISGAFSGERGVMVMGKAADGEGLRAGFSADGTLMRFGRGGDMGPGGGDHGKWDHGDRRGGKHGDNDRHGRRGDRPEHRRGAALSDEAAAAAATAAGYTAPGTVTREGPRTLIQATNPQGESVLLELGPKGDVVRETAQ